MKQLLATAAIAAIISTPALAADFTYGNTTVSEADYTALQAAAASYGNESGSDRATRLTKEMIDIMESGDAYNNRWHKIISVANKEGWGSELTAVVDNFNLTANYSNLWDQVQDWQDFYSFIDTNGLDAFTMPERSAIQADIDAAWAAQDQSVLSGIESAFKEGYGQGYDAGYVDGWNDAMNAIEEEYPNS